MEQADVLVPERFTSHAGPHVKRATYRVTPSRLPAASLLIGSAMKSLLLVLVVLVLLSCVPPGKMKSPSCTINGEGKQGAGFYKSEKKAELG